MATARIVFNDFFHPREGGRSWAVRRHAGNDKTQQEITETWHDGNLATVEAFHSPQIGTRLVELFQNGNSINAKLGIGLINNTLGGTVASIANQNARIVSDGNFLYTVPRNFFVDFNVDTANNHNGGYISIIYVGEEHDIELDYPVGWKPPFIQMAEDRIRLQRDIYPRERGAKPKPINVQVPITLQPKSAGHGTLQAIIHRMQNEPFLFQWSIHDDAHVLFGWLDSHGGFSFTAGGLLGINLNLRGYIGYGDAV